MTSRDEQKKREITIQDCMRTWHGTLAHYGIDRGVSQWEETQIARAIQRVKSAEMVELALFGARFEKKTESFDPKDYVSLSRVLDRDREGRERIDLYANFGSRKRRHQSESVKSHEEQPVDQERTDPARVREIIANAFKGIK